MLELRFPDRIPLDSLDRWQLDHQSLNDTCLQDIRHRSRRQFLLHMTRSWHLLGEKIFLSGSSCTQFAS